MSMTCALCERDAWLDVGICSACAGPARREFGFIVRVAAHATAEQQLRDLLGTQLECQSLAEVSRGRHRRTFVRTLSAAGAGLALGPFDASASQLLRARSARKRYALVGTGSRSQMYRNAILRDYKETTELVGLSDINPGRLELARRHATDTGEQVPGFIAADFDRMIRETRPDVVIVTTVAFDLVNWWLGAVPVPVFATGKRALYTPAMAKRFGLNSHHERCRTCPEKDRCTFFFDHHGGACSILIGIAPNRCFETGQPVKIANLVTGLRSPRYAPMPTRRDPVPMPPAVTRGG